MNKEAMKRFLIETSIENAEGSQTWYVDATSEAEALKKYEQGGCDLYASNVDVTSLGEPEISGETTLDDFGDFAEQPRAFGTLAQQEPVAWRYTDARGHYRYRGFVANFDKKYPMLKPQPLYTPTPAQRTWVGLSDAQSTVIWANSKSVDEAIRATEKQLMENNI